MTEHYTCRHCGETILTTPIWMNESPLCESCAEETTMLCSHCGERIWRDDNAGDESTPLCQDCYDRHYTNCHNCGDIIRISQTYYACESDGNAAEVMSIANGCGLENLYCKHDGSLDDGFEMVTHPMTLAYHQAEMPWAAILQKAVQMGYTSHQAGTCGLHVHVNRNAFGETEAQQDAVIARILYFFEKNWEELLKFSRRTHHQLDQWAARYGYKDQPKELLDHAKKSAHAGRYTSVNLTNKNTIEFRIFRGTLKYNTLIATLQLLDRICDVALFMSDEELKAMSWTTFVSGCTQPELVQYLKERRLYVNEPIESEAEV